MSRPWTCRPARPSSASTTTCRGAGRNIEAQIKLATPGAVDILPLDDRAFTVLPERRQQRVLIVTRGNLFLEGALLATGAGKRIT